MGQHSANDPVNQPVNQPVNDPGNSEPEHLTADLDDDELADVLALLAEQDEIRDNQRMLREQQIPFDAGGVLPAGTTSAYNGTTVSERVLRPDGAP